MRHAILAAALLATSAVACARDPQFDGHCAMSAALGNKLPTTCKVVWISPQTDKLYCFSSESAKAMFLANPQKNERSAQAFWQDPAFWEKLQRERGDGG